MRGVFRLRTASGDFHRRGFAIYAVAAGVIVPAAPFWPARRQSGMVRRNHRNAHSTAARDTGLRTRVLGLGDLGTASRRGSGSERYTAYLRRQFVWTVVAMCAILVFGWTLTEFLGGNLPAERRARSSRRYRPAREPPCRRDRHHRRHGKGAGRFTIDTAVVDRRQPAGRPARPVGSGSRRRCIRRHARHDPGQVRNHGGLVRPDQAAASNSDRSAPWFQTSIAGEAGYHFAFDAAGRRPYYYTSYPVRNDNGAMVGVAVLQKSLDGSK